MITYEAIIDEGYNFIQKPFSIDALSSKISPKIAIELKSLVKSASKIGKAGVEFLYDTI